MGIDQFDTNKMAEKLTDWNNEPGYSDLNADLESAGSYQDRVREKLLEWEQTREGGPKVKTKPGKSTIRPKLVRKQNEWKYPALEEPFLSTSDMFKIKPKTEEDPAAALQNEQLINYQWSSEIDKVALVGEIVRTVIDEGTVIVKTGWESEEGTKIVEEERPVYANPEESMMMLQQMVQSGEITEARAQAMIETGEPVQKGTEKVYVEKETLVVNRPKYEVCNNANVIVDPTCEGNLKDANFIIHEYATNYAELKKQEYNKVVEIIEVEDEDGNKIEQKKINETGIYKNLHLLKDGEGEYISTEHDSINSQDFSYSDKARKRLKAFEYWGYWDIEGNGVLEPIIATWVGSTMIRMEKNPFPFDGLPFDIATYMPVRKEINGEPDAEILKENQESVGKMMRAAHDIVSSQAVGQKFIDENFVPSGLQRKNLEAGNTVYYRTGMDPKRSIHHSSVENVPNTVFTMMDAQLKDAESLSGTVAFTGGISGRALGDSVTGQRNALDATAKRDLSILRRLSNLFKGLCRKTIAMNQSYMPEEQIIRITNDFVKIRRDDLGGLFDLEIDVSTPEVNNQIANDLAMILQTGQQSLPPQVVQKIWTKIARLKKQPDLAKDIEEYQPEPDPATEELKRIELENALLAQTKLKKEIEEIDSRIHERISRVIENEADVENKQSQTDLRRAQARKLNSESDLKDEEFVQIRTGQKRKENIQDKVIDTKIQRENVEHQAGVQKSAEELEAMIVQLQQQLQETRGE